MPTRYNPDLTEQFDSRVVDGEFIWDPVENGGFLKDGAVNPDNRHGGKNGYDDRPFVEYVPVPLGSLGHGMLAVRGQRGQQAHALAGVRFFAL